jgi:hypothetical protein
MSQLHSRPVVYLGLDHVGTLEMPLGLEADNMHIVKWWVDASCAVHPNMKSHTGSVTSLGKGTVYRSSTQQKLNTGSSTEAKLLSMNDVMSQVLWPRYFLKHKARALRTL